MLGGQTGANLETNYERDDRDTFLGSSILQPPGFCPQQNLRPASIINTEDGDSSRRRLGDEDEVIIMSQIRPELETRRQVIKL